MHSFFSSHHEYDETAIKESFIAGQTIREICATQAVSDKTLRMVLKEYGLYLNASQKRQVREHLQEGVSVEKIAADAEISTEAVQAVKNRMRNAGEIQQKRHPDIMNLAKQGYSRERIAELTGVGMQVVSRTLQGLDLYADRTASVAKMYDTGMTVEEITEELGISENRARGMLRAAGRIAGPAKPLRGFQNPNNYAFRNNHPSGRPNN